MNNIIRLDSTESTNRDAFRLASKGAQHGTVIITDNQTKGRGRLGKSWESPVGKGLYCSIILRPELVPHLYPYLTFVAGLAVADAIDKIYSLSAQLKWPNDIYFNWKKCGGILTESSDLNGAVDDRFAIVGVGLNINAEKSDFPSDLQETATSLYIESGVIVEIEAVLLEVRDQLLLQVTDFERNGFSHVIERWRKRDFLIGKRLAWVAVTGKKVEGISLGPDDQGRLHVQDDTGVIHEVMSGDIQLCSQSD